MLFFSTGTHKTTGALQTPHIERLRRIGVYAMVVKTHLRNTDISLPGGFAATRRPCFGGQREELWS